MIKAVIFDMDGLIVDSETVNSLSWKKLLAERGIKPIFTDQGLIHEVGPVGNSAYQKVMDRHGIKDDVEIIRKRRREIFEELLKEKLTPLPGFLNLIEVLKKKKIKIAVASNRIIKHVYLILENLGIKDSFEVITGPSPTINHKPKPDIYLETAKNLGVKVNECIVLEDSETGIEAAKRAGMKVIAVPHKFTIKQNFSKADKIVKSLNEVTIGMINNL